MGREIKGHLSHCGRVISAEGLADIRETVATCSSLSRSELALMIAEHLEWYSESIDPERYTGMCYRAANWLYVGDTTGTGLTLQGKSYTTIA